MDLLTVKEAATVLKLSCGAVYALCKAGTLPHHRLGLGQGAIRIGRQDLLAYIEACKTGAASVTRSGSSTPRPDSPIPMNRLPVGGFKHLRLDQLLGAQPLADGPTSGQGDHNGR
jgi:excisionase family DNA binding protein